LEVSGSLGGEYKDVFWDIARVVWCKLTDVSQLLAASIIIARMVRIMKVFCFHKSPEKVLLLSSLEPS
jgi:hypothetical protein